MTEADSVQQPNFEELVAKCIDKFNATETYTTPEGRETPYPLWRAIQNTAQGIPNLDRLFIEIVKNAGVPASRIRTIVGGAFGGDWNDFYLQASCDILHHYFRERHPEIIAEDNSRAKSNPTI